MIVEQVPEKLIEDAYKNTNLKVMHRLPSASDRELIGGTMRFAPDQERYASSLEPFQAFAHHDGIDRLGPDPGAERTGRGGGGDRGGPGAARRQRGTGRPVPRLRRGDTGRGRGSCPPFPDCEGCRHRCTFRSRAATAVWPEHGEELKKKVVDYPRTSAAQAEWWSRTADWVAGIADTVAPPGAAPEAVEDYRACVFIHVAQAAWKRKTLPWVRLYRSHAVRGRGGTKADS
ncbi:hypothetical protein GCM10020000_41950 [Streptomyces olivoverticillatus]